jgi:hypothetical protein
MRKLLTSLATVGVLLGSGTTSHAATIDLITNGGFEAGLAGWTSTSQAGSSAGAGWFSDTLGSTTPFSSFATSAVNGGGALYAVTDQGGPGTHTLRQSFTVAPGAQVMLSFSMFVNDQSGSGGIVNPAGLDFTAGANQHARVDILTAAAGAFDTGAGVVGNFYLGVDAGANPHAFTNYSFDISALVGAGGTFQLRFAEVDNQLFFNQGVDNVSILQTTPEPATLLLLGTGLGAALYRRRRTTK